jgi:peptidoglycan/xylan/chitin deacetylase (PgdA/CDA1 family)
MKETADETRCLKHFLYRIVNKPVSSFAFPYGAYSPDTIAEAKKTNYKQLLTFNICFKEDHEDTAMRKRFAVNPFISPVNQMGCFNNQEL